MECLTACLFQVLYGEIKLQRVVVVAIVGFDIDFLVCV